MSSVKILLFKWEAMIIVELCIMGLGTSITVNWPEISEFVEFPG